MKNNNSQAPNPTNTNTPTNKVTPELASMTPGVPAKPEPIELDTVEDKLRYALYTYNMDTGVGGMNEDKAVGYFVTALTTLINKEVERKSLEARAKGQIEALQSLIDGADDTNVVLTSKIRFVIDNCEEELKKLKEGS